MPQTLNTHRTSSTQIECKVCDSPLLISLCSRTMFFFSDFFFVSNDRKKSHFIREQHVRAMIKAVGWWCYCYCGDCRCWGYCCCYCCYVLRKHLQRSCDDIRSAAIDVAKLIRNCVLIKMYMHEYTLSLPFLSLSLARSLAHTFSLRLSVIVIVTRCCWSTLMNAANWD